MRARTGAATDAHRAKGAALHPHHLKQPAVVYRVKRVAQLNALVEPAPPLPAYRGVWRQTFGVVPVRARLALKLRLAFAVRLKRRQPLGLQKRLPKLLQLAHHLHLPPVLPKNAPRRTFVQGLRQNRSGQKSDGLTIASVGLCPLSQSPTETRYPSDFVGLRLGWVCDDCVRLWAEHIVVRKGLALSVTVLF